MKDVLMREGHLGSSLNIVGWLARPVDGMARFATGLMNGLFSCDCVSGVCVRIAVCHVKAKRFIDKMMDAKVAGATAVEVYTKHASKHRTPRPGNTQDKYYGF